MHVSVQPFDTKDAYDLRFMPFDPAGYRRSASNVGNKVPSVLS